jgi:hypothetical protein
LRNVSTTRALAAELDALRKKHRRLGILKALTVAGAADVLDLGAQLRVRKESRLKRQRLARSNLARERLQFRVAEKRRGQRLTERQDARGLAEGLRGRMIPRTLRGLVAGKPLGPAFVSDTPRGKRRARTHEDESNDAAGERAAYARVMKWVHGFIPLGT